jgi:phosphatidylinositol alpha-1,6-mannosyltransferase
VSAGGYPEAEARRTSGRLPPIVQVPPGVDTRRFTPLARIEKVRTRTQFGLPGTGSLVVSVSRLVPRKGMDVLIEASARLAATGRHPDLTVVIAGQGREKSRLERLIRRRGAPVRLLGRVPGGDLAGLYACADAFALCCRSRWAGLEQEGFGIVFLEAAAAGVPQVAGDSGGASEAVVHGETGLVVADPRDPGAVAEALRSLLADPNRRRRMGRAARSRVQESFDNDVLASRLADALAGVAI